MSGCAEAKQLADILSGALRGKRGRAAAGLQPPAVSAEWRSLLGLDGGLVPQADTDPWIRQHAQQLLPCLPASGADLAALAQQIRLDLR